MVRYLLLLMFALLLVGQTANDKAAAQAVREAFGRVLTGDVKTPYAWPQLDAAAMRVWQELGSHIVARLNGPLQQSPQVLEEEASRLLDGAKPPEIYGTKVRVFATGQPGPPAYLIFAQFEMAAVTARNGVVLCVSDAKSGKFRIVQILSVLRDRELDVAELHYRGKLRLLLYGVQRGSTRSNLDLELYEVSADKINLLWGRQGLPQGQARVVDRQIELRWIHKPTYPFGFTVERFVQRERGLKLVKTTKGVER